MRMIVPRYAVVAVAVALGFPCAVAGGVVPMNPFQSADDRGSSSTLAGSVATCGAGPYSIALATLPTLTSAREAVLHVAHRGPVWIEPRPSGFTVLVGNYATYEMADQEFHEISRRDGLLMDGIEYRGQAEVVLGSGLTKAEAKVVVEELHDEGYLTPYQRFGEDGEVEVFWPMPSPEHAEALVEMLAASGFVAETIREEAVFGGMAGVQSEQESRSETAILRQ